MYKNGVLNPKNTRLEVQGRMIRFGVILLLCLFLTSFISAEVFTFDNVVSYSPDNMKATIVNFFGIGGDIGTAELKSHVSTSQVKSVQIGKDVPVMWYEFSNWKDIYVNGLGEVEFIDKNTGKKIDKDYYFAKQVYYEIDVNEYKNVCSELLTEKNGTKYQNCADEIVGTHKEQRMRWERLSKGDIPMNTITIALMTEVKPNDRIDGVWTIAGKKITEHAEWTASLNVGLVSYYTLNETSGGVIDSLGHHEGTNYNAVRGVEGKQNNSFQYDGTADYTSLGQYGFDTFTAMTACFWMNPVNTQADRGVLSALNPQLSIGFAFESSDGGKLNFIVSSSGGFNGNKANSNSPITTGVWTFACGRWDGTTLRMYINGVNQSLTASHNTALFNGNDLFIGRNYDTSGSYDFNGKIDEVAIWNVSLSDEQILYMYNSGAGMTYGTGISPDATPTVTLVSPANLTVSNDISIAFNCTATDDKRIENLSLYINDVLNYTVVDGVDNYTGLDKTLNLAVGNDYNWTCRAYDNSTQQGNGTYYWFNVTTIPAIDFIDPTPVNSFNSSSSSFIVNVSLTETYFNNVTFQLWNTSGGISNTTYTNSVRWNEYTSLPDGNYTYNATVWTTTGEKNTTETRTLLIYTRSPEVNVTYPDTNTLNFHVNNNLGINWSVSDPYLETCIGSFDVGVTNFTVLCLDNNITMNITSPSNHSFMIWANNSFGFSSMSIKNFDFNVLEYSQTFTSTALERSSQTFSINVDYNSTRYSNIQGILMYNGVQYSGTKIGTGNNVVFNRTITTPDVASTTIYPFYWKFILGSSELIVNSTSQNQTVNNLKIGTCDNNAVGLYNFTILAEKTQAFINGTTHNTSVQVDVTLYTPSRLVVVANYSNNYTKMNPFTVCLNNSLTDEEYSLDLQILYSADEYTPEYYNIQNGTIKSSTLSQLINLYDLENASSTPFKISYKDENFLPLENVLIQVQRQYLSEGVFKTVEIPKTDSNGQTIAHLEEENVLYNFIVVKNGEILSTFNNFLVKCEDPVLQKCSINLNAFKGSLEPTDFSNIKDFSFTMTYNRTTREVQGIYSVPSGNTATVLLNVSKYDALSNTTLCSSTLSSASGTLSCVVPITYGNATLVIEMFKDGKIVGRSFLGIGDSPSSIYGTNIAFLGLIMVLMILGVSLGSNPVVSLIFLILGGIMLVAFNIFTNSGFIGYGATILWLIIAIVVMIIKAARRE